MFVFMYCIYDVNRFSNAFDVFRPKPVAADATNFFYNLDAWSTVGKRPHNDCRHLVWV